METKNTAVAKINEVSPANLLQLAVENNLDVEKLSKLMDLQERWDKQKAKKSFLTAMSEFQSRCPILQKSKKVGFISKRTGGKVDYSYIPLGDIANQIKEVLKNCELSYRWETKEENQLITITCIVSHIDGHSEENSMSAGKDDSGMKNQIQQIGSTMTYLQRYSLIGALGITTADVDMDARERVSEPKSKLSKGQSKERLNKTIIIIGEFTKYKDFMGKYKAIVRDETKAGMHQEDLADLKRCVNAKNVALRKAEMDKTIKLP